MKPFKNCIQSVKNALLMSGITVIPVLILIPLLLVMTPLILVSFWTDRTIDFWLSQMMHHTVDLPWFVSFVITLFLSGAIFFINIVSEIARLAM